MLPLSGSHAWDRVLVVCHGPNPQADPAPGPVDNPHLAVIPKRLAPHPIQRRQQRLNHTSPSSVNTASQVIRTTLTHIPPHIRESRLVDSNQRFAGLLCMDGASPLPRTRRIPWRERGAADRSEVSTKMLCAGVDFGSGRDPGHGCVSPSSCVSPSNCS